MNVGVPIYQPGKEPLPPGLTEEDRPQLMQQKKVENWMRMASESCAFKTVLSGGAGFALGAFFSLMSASFQYEDPMNRLTNDPNLSTRQKTSEFFKSTGRGMWRSGAGFAKVGALYSGVECCIEGFRAKNDITNAVTAGFISGAILARNSGPRAAAGGGLAFAAFSGAIDLFMRRESSEATYAKPNPGRDILCPPTSLCAAPYFVRGKVLTCLNFAAMIDARNAF